jgi:glycosyltransferase involved in cell wall biosynthesis
VHLDAIRTAAGGTPRVRVSVITVVYNGVDEIEKTVLSIIGQRYAGIEYIVVDGGSTDGTLEVLARYRDRIAVLVSEKDGGIYDAMNKGLKLAGGEWINFMNCGDFFHNDQVVADVVRELDPDHGFLAGGYTMFSDAGTSAHEAALPELGKMPSCHQAIFFHARLAKRYPYQTSYKVGADYDVICRMLGDGASFLLSPVMVVDMNALGFSSANFTTWVHDYRAVIRANYGWSKATIWAAKVLVMKYLPALGHLVPRAILRKLGV